MRDLERNKFNTPTFSCTRKLITSGWKHGLSVVILLARQVLLKIKIISKVLEACRAEVELESQGSEITDGKDGISHYSSLQL